MSPASRSKTKDKKAGNEPQKASSKPSGHANAGSGVPASGYNPLLGTFHTLETVSVSSAPPLHTNDRFRNIDETDDHSGNSLGTGEYDSVSNNDSWSGESEDQKEKASHPPLRQEVAIPGADNDKREKIRQKNERKHQRQKEKRAQELHERCNGYLMSRKLEALAQQLVAMGFSSERGTMALILNEGRVEESVAWLFEGGEEADKHREHNLDSGSNLKIDISEELARIADMEIRFKCSKQEVERAIVACEGDLEKAAETLGLQKQEPPSAQPQPEETGDPPTVSNGKLPVAVSQNPLRAQPNSNSSTIIQQKRDEKDFNYAKTAVTIGASVESGGKNLQPLRRIQLKLEWAKQQQTAMPAEKRWPSAGSNPSVSYSLASPLQATAPAAKMEARYVAAGNELKNLQLGSVREPVVVMQRPQPLNTKQVPTTSISSSPPGSAASWYPNSVDIMKPNGLPHIPSTRSLSPSNLTSNQFYNQLHYQQHQQFVSSGGSMDSPGTSRGNGSWSRTVTSPTVAAASSLGLFSGLGSNGSSGSSSPVDWNTGGSMLQLDYTNIDWTLDRGSSSSRSIGLWQGLASVTRNNSHIYDSYTSGLNARTALRPGLSNRNGVSNGGAAAAAAETSAGGSREWSSPFEERDLFSLPRQFVSSPSL
uniref:UBA domain-containing protein n=1 Tax=Davidia involucrata TaxID=16924 RepID=A0A5B6ZRW6_DAVIN